MWSWRVLPAVFWKLALQQTAQQVGHGQALREGRHLDARPHGGSDVQRQASGVAVALIQHVGLTLANPRFGAWICGRTCADADALGLWWTLGGHVSHRSSSSTSAVISRAAALSGAISHASRPAATLSAKTIRCRTSVRSAGNSCSASACRASGPLTVVLTRRFMNKAACKASRNTWAARIRPPLQARAPKEEGQ